MGIVTGVFLMGFAARRAAGQLFLTAVSLTVAAILEGLPAIVTSALALGVMREVKLLEGILYSA